jgi:hypothetical protein
MLVDCHRAYMRMGATNAAPIIVLLDAYCSYVPTTRFCSRM